MTNKKQEPKKVIMRTEVLSELVTRHSQKIAALGPNEEFVVKYTMGGEEFTTVDGVVQEKEDEKNV